MLIVIFRKYLHSFAVPLSYSEGALWKYPWRFKVVRDTNKVKLLVISDRRQAGSGFRWTVCFNSDILAAAHSWRGCVTHPWPGSRAMARGCSMPPAISVVRISPLSFATSIWSRLLSIQYSLSVIQSTARPSGVARPCCTTTSIPDTPAVGGGVNQ